MSIASQAESAASMLTECDASVAQWTFEFLPPAQITLATSGHCLKLAPSSPETATSSLVSNPLEWDYYW